jgi:hypothetical protein
LLIGYFVFSFTYGLSYVIPDATVSYNQTFLFIMSLWASTFYIFAVGFDLYKWCLFLIAAKNIEFLRKERFIVIRLRLKVILFIFQSIVLAVAIFLSTIIGLYLYFQYLEVQTEKQEKVVNVILDGETTYYLITYTILFIAYIVISAMIIVNLKKLYPRFYNQEKIKVKIITIGLRSLYIDICG